MKGFMLDSNGDVVIVKNRIQMVEGAELQRQTVQQILNTNKGEWMFNPDEGINFHNILGKHQSAPKREENDAMRNFYNKEIEHVKADNRQSLQRLANRLEGN